MCYAKRITTKKEAGFNTLWSMASFENVCKDHINRKQTKWLPREFLLTLHAHSAEDQDGQLSANNLIDLLTPPSTVAQRPTVKVMFSHIGWFAA